MGLEKPHSMIYKCETHGITSVIINKGIIKTLPRPPKVGILVHYSASTSLSTAPNRKMLTGSGITSVIINKGIIKTLPRPPKVGILVHYSASTSLSTAPNRKMLTGSVKEALRLGADGVSLHINIGGNEEPEMLQDLGAISEQCHEWNVPLLAMMYPRGENIKDPHDPEIVAHAARIGAECGADIVKTLYTGDVDSFTKVVESIPVPVVIAGGPKSETDMDLLKMTEDAMNAGAKGVTYGRNIFAHKKPEKIVEAISRNNFQKSNIKRSG